MPMPIDFPAKIPLSKFAFLEPFYPSFGKGWKMEKMTLKIC